MPFIIPEVILVPVEPPATIECNGRDGGSFLWKGHDFAITLPPDCADETVTISLKAYLPVNTQGSCIVSTVFAVTTNIKKFKKPIKIRFPHWITTKSKEDNEKLCFLIIHTKYLEFKTGYFEFGGSFGSIEVDHFCLFCACWGNISSTFICLTSALHQFGSHQIAGSTQLPSGSITPSKTNLNKLSMPEKKYLDLLILPDCHKERMEWNGIYCVILDCSSYLQVK